MSGEGRALTFSCAGSADINLLTEAWGGEPGIRPSAQPCVQDVSVCPSHLSHGYSVPVFPGNAELKGGDLQLDSLNRNPRCTVHQPWDLELGRLSGPLCPSFWLSAG